MKNTKFSFFYRLSFYYAILSTFVIVGFPFYFIINKEKQAKATSKSIPKVMQTINPTTEEIIFSCNTLTSLEIRACISKAANVQKEWANLSFEERGVIIKKVGEILRTKQEEYARMITESMGKTITEARAEIIKCANLCDYYAEHAAQFLATEEEEIGDQVIYQSYEPLGVIFAVMPWNFPFWQVFRFAIPNLMAGNVGLLKHASNVGNIGKVIEEIFLEAGCPSGVFQFLAISSQQVNEVIENPDVAGVTLTGSERAGSAVASAAGKLLKPAVLELGGNDPFIIYPDANLDLAVEKCVKSRCNNTGQVCIAAKRIILIGDIKEAFMEKLIAYVDENYTHGDPLLSTTQLGPMARADLRDSLHKQVTKTVEAGATCLRGGNPIEGRGYFYPVTILTDIPKESPAYTEELFGPVICIFHVASEEEAIELANDTDYGLAAAIFTTNVNHGIEVALTKIYTGTCYVNDLVVSDQRLPFGGIKRSGYGRELGKEGIRAFMNRKVVVLKKYKQQNESK